MAHDEQVMAVLLRLEGSIGGINAKLDGLIGKDGNNGKVGDLDDRVTELEKAHNRRNGAIAVIGAGWTALVITIQHLWKN